MAVFSSPPPSSLRSIQNDRSCPSHVVEVFAVVVFFLAATSQMQSKLRSQLSAMDQKHCRVCVYLSMHEHILSHVVAHVFCLYSWKQLKSEDEMWSFIDVHAVTDGALGAL